MEQLSIKSSTVKAFPSAVTSLSSIRRPISFTVPATIASASFRPFNVTTPSTKRHLVSEARCSSAGPTNPTPWFQTESPVHIRGNGRHVRATFPANRGFSKTLHQIRTYSNDAQKGASSGGNKDTSRLNPEISSKKSSSLTTKSDFKPSDKGETGKHEQSPEVESLTSSMSRYLHLPRMPHRPSKEELLAAATNFRQRLQVRFKWMSIRSMRPWNVDEWGAFISWFMLGHLVWILVGTTTFFSLVILSINTVFAQGEPVADLIVFSRDR